MKLIRKLLYSLLGKTLYFRTVSKSFLILYRVGILKVFKKFKTHYLAKRLIRKDDVIIDIGANFGYYTSIFARATEKKGMVYAVEPVPLYQKILKANTKRFSNIALVPFALSDTEGSSHMGIPSGEKYRHGLTRILDKGVKQENDNDFAVITKLPETLFGTLKALDYIKCDIEGHEIKVIPGFRKLIEKFEPIIQIELEETNFETINNMLRSYGYSPFSVSQKGIARVEEANETQNDIIYIPENRMTQLKNI